MDGRASRLYRSGTLRRSASYTHIRQQINEQLKCLDMRVEVQAAIVLEIQDFFRRRAEVELEYSRSLEKLSRSLTLRHKAEKQKREQWHLFSSNLCWEHLLSATRKESRDRAILSEIFANTLTSRFGEIVEDVHRMYKRCRDIGMESHEELLKVLHELHASMKTYHAYHSDERQMESKLRLLEAQKTKLEQSAPAEKLQRLKKYRLIVKDLQKRQSKYNDAKLKSLKARNDYLLCMDAANAAVQKYYVDDLPDLLDCMDFGFYTCLGRTLKVYVSAEECLQKLKQNGIDRMMKCVDNLDARVDKRRFLEHNNSAFMVPKKFEFQAHKGDQVSQLFIDKAIKEEVEQRYKQLNKRLTSLKTENEEVWKTLETAERSLLDMISIKDYDCSLLFSEESNNRNGLRQPETLALKLRADRQETEDFYLNKFRKYTLDGNLIARLQAKAELIHRGIIIENAKSNSGDSPPSTVLRPHTLLHRTKKKRIGQTPVVGQPKLFGGSLEEYLDATNQEIPLIVRSCIRIINLYGLQHQGVFRVSGSQVEINNFKEAFERGEDPLADVTDTGDINSVAGVLKLYLRELREPLFPIFFFDQLVEISQVESKHEFVTKVRDVIASLPRAVFVLLRYLFAFLNHVSEFSDENMMDPYNLATCFGPSLMPIPDDKNQVQYQNLFNELIKNIIIYQDEIFPTDGGIIYEKYISADVPDENDVGESPVDHNLDDPDTLDSYEADILPSEDECEVLEAVAQCSFSGRTDRELSFKEGDTVQLFNQVSSKWWRGSLNGKEGLVPDKYVFLKLRDEDKDKLSQDGSEKRRTSSSSDSLSGYSTSPKPSIDTNIPEEGTTGSEFFPQDSLSTFPSNSVSSSGFSSLHSSNTPIRRRLSLSPTTLRKVQLATAGEFDQPKLVHSSSVGEAMEGIIRDENLLGEFYLSDPERKGWNRLEADLHDMLFSSSHADIIKEKNKIDGSRSRDSIKQNPFSLSKGTPDLVKDLPNNSPSPELPIKICNMEDEDDERPSSRSSIQSCESPELTTAERFAMSHQGTLKKGSVSRISYSGLESTLPAKVWAKTQTITVSLDGSDPSEKCSDVFNVTNEIRDQTEQDFVESSPEVPCKPVHLKQDLDMPKNSAIEQSSQALYAKGISNFKPPTKVKPPVMKKPTNPLSMEPAKFQQKEYKQTSC